MSSSFLTFAAWLAGATVEDIADATVSIGTDGTRLLDNGYIVRETADGHFEYIGNWDTDEMDGDE